MGYTIVIARYTMNVYTHHLAYLRNTTRNMMTRITSSTTSIAPTIPPAIAPIEEEEAKGGGG